MRNVINLASYSRIKLGGIRKEFSKVISDYLKDEDGAGVIELVLILVVLIGLVLVFKDKIGVLLNDIFKNINSSADAIYNN